MKIVEFDGKYINFEQVTHFEYLKKDYLVFIYTAATNAPIQVKANEQDFAKLLEKLNLVSQ